MDALAEVALLLGKLSKSQEADIRTLATFLREHLGTVAKRISEHQAHLEVSKQFKNLSRKSFLGDQDAKESLRQALQPPQKGHNCNKYKRSSND